MLEILGQSTNPSVIQTHLKKLFAGIHSVEFDDNAQHILAMKSLDGEVVPLLRKVKIMPEVEVCGRLSNTGMKNQNFSYCNAFIEKCTMKSFNLLGPCYLITEILLICWGIILLVAILFHYTW